MSQNLTELRVICRIAEECKKLTCLPCGQKLLGAVTKY